MTRPLPNRSGTTRRSPYTDGGVVSVSILLQRKTCRNCERRRSSSSIKRPRQKSGTVFLRRCISRYVGVLQRSAGYGAPSDHLPGCRGRVESLCLHANCYITKPVDFLNSLKLQAIPLLVASSLPRRRWGPAVRVQTSGYPYLRTAPWCWSLLRPTVISATAVHDLRQSRAKAGALGNIDTVRSTLGSLLSHGDKGGRWAASADTSQKDDLSTPLSSRYYLASPGLEGPGLPGAAALQRQVGARTMNPATALRVLGQSPGT